MRRLLLVCVVLVLSAMGVSVPFAAVAAPTRALDVTGTEAAMYPAFDPTIDRYALTTTTNTAGTVDVVATPGPGESVLIDGGTSTHLTGLAAGDLITVAFTGGTSPHTYTVMYLPAGFPKLTVITGAQGTFPNLAPGLVAVTLFPYGGPQLPPAYDAIVDRNGVPVYAHVVSTQNLQLRDFDLKQQPTGEITVQRPTTEPSPATGYSAAVLDPLNQFQETSHTQVAPPLTNTDFHDSVRLPDGSTILLGYEPNAATGKTDGTIEKLDSAGHETFRWSTAPYAAETMAGPSYLGSHGDYAHLNSVVSVENGDIIASFRHMSAAYRIATVAHDGYQPGDVIWKLGGRDSSFTFVGDGASTPGPCGQHTVSELPNGHILIFDNGSDGLCVDPSDPLNPGINRGFTRITEYALDTVAHTATLVWSYAPAGKYSLFAGSARRARNGNTLIAWASDSSALATEVDASGTKLWELTTPDNGPGASRYISYRAELVTGPRLTLSGPADGSTFVAGDPVPASGSCTDWVGTGPASCSVVGADGGVLDTSSAGAHSWSVTGTDASGNVTTQVRRYTVRLAARQPDGLIRKAGSMYWKGGNVYGSASLQTVRQDARRRRTAVAAWQVQNDGERADGLRLVATGSYTRVRVHYFAAGVDVTRAVVAGTYRTPTLAPGQSFTLRVEVRPTRRARAGAVRTFALRAVSVNNGSRIDAVATRVTVRR